MADPIAKHIAQQAVQWLVELQAGANEQQRRNWQRWREADPEHERAWQRIESMNQRLRGLSPQATRRALDGQTDTGRRQALKLLGLMAIAAPTGWLGYQHAQPWLADYRTGVGERRSFVLAEGSELSLNTDTAVNLLGIRHLVLVQGEMQLMALPHNLAFQIDTSQGRLLTEHSHFNLRQYANDCQLSVLTGQVQVNCTQQPELQVRVRAGQQVRFSAHQVGDIQPFETRLAAWRSGMLVAVDMRLGDFLDELSRYHRGWLDYDPQIAHLRVSGTYPLADIQAAIDLVERLLPIEVQRRTRYWIRVYPRQTA